MHPIFNKELNLNWLHYGDDNTTLFHNSIKSRRNHNRINTLTINGNLISDPSQIQNFFLLFYLDLLCCKLENRKRIQMPIVQAEPILNSTIWPMLDLSFSADEIKKALWSINENKSSWT